MYKLINAALNPDGTVGIAAMVKRTTDSSFIPMDEANTDYQEYLEWIAAGNTPEAAE
tara:strand:+ start:965 stop:1135 length:171 start_codon:yes stop_codon:yes gene_type:complete